MMSGSRSWVALRRGCSGSGPEPTFLVNRSTIAQLAVDAITYYHIELPQHDVVFAEGLPAETYLETGGRHTFESDGGVIQLHPNFARDEARAAVAWRSLRLVTVWQGCGYAPLLGDGSQLNRALAPYNPSPPSSSMVCPVI
jgi:hypothetical protein